MPALLEKIDTLFGAELEASSTDRQTTRGAFVSGLDTTQGTAGTIYQVLTSRDSSNRPFPSLRSSHPADPNLLLQQVRVFPVSDTQARALLVYRLPQFQGASAYILEDDSTLQSFTSAFMPGTWEPIRVSYDSAEDPDFKENFHSGFVGDEAEIVPNIIVPEDKIDMEFLRPIRTLSVTQLVLGRPKPPTGFGTYSPDNVFGSNNPTPTAASGYVGFVNSKPWQGFPTGFWLLSRFASRISRYDGYYQTQVTAICKTIEPWSQLGILYNSVTGKYVQLGSSLATDARKQPYKPGISYPKDNKKCGMVIVGPYPMIDFSGILDIDT